MPTSSSLKTYRLAAIGVAILTFALLVALETRAAESETASTWIRNAFLVEPGTQEPPQLADVLIHEGKIVEVRPVGSGVSDSNSVDAGGRYLLPGFIDTHVHVALGPVAFDMVDGAPQMKLQPDAEVTRRSMLSLLAHGITTARDPGGPTETLVDLRRRQAKGDIEGPRLRVAGAVIDRLPFEGLTTAVEGPEQARAEVRRQAEAGVDWIKLYTQLSPEELKAAIDEAHAHGLKTVAHLQRVPWTEAVELGLDAIVHGIPGSEELLPTHTHEAYLPDLAGTRFLYSWFEHVDLGSPEIRHMVKTLAEAGTTLDLTLVAFEAMVRGDQPWRTRAQPELGFVAPSLVENWSSFFTFNIGWQPEDFERAKRSWPKALAFARLLHESGIALTVGTDANNPWTVAGPSFHRELELLADAGIEPRDILRMATVNGASALDLEGRIGTLRVGSDADLVLLDRNPLDDISATRDIAWVMQRGRLYFPDTLLRQALDPSYDD